MWTAALLLMREFLIERTEGFGPAIVKNAQELAIVLMVATGGVLIVTSCSSIFPPDRIFEWGERIERTKRLLEAVVKYALWVLLASAVLYLLLARMQLATDHLARGWKAMATGRKWVKRTALVLMVVASFTFTAQNAVDGPIVQLTKQRAEALSKYADLVWNTELQLNREIKLQMLTATYEAQTQEVQAALARESELDWQSSGIPSVYFRRESPLAQSRAQLLRWKDPRPEQRRDWAAMVQAANEAGHARERRGMGAAEPPRGVSMRAIERAQHELSRAAEVTTPPKWLDGLGEEAAKKLFDFATPVDAVPFLKALSESRPLLAELIGIALDAGKDVSFRSLKESALRMTKEAKGTAGSIVGDLRRGASEQIPRPRTIALERLMEVRKNQAARAGQLAAARRRLEDDLLPAIDRAKREADEFARKMADLGIQEVKVASRASASLGLLLPPVNSIDLEGTQLAETAGPPSIGVLRAQTSRLNACRETVARAMANQQVPAERVRKVFGPKYAELQYRKEEIVRQRIEVERVQRGIQERIREVERAREVVR
jgi:hypothetical protein